MLNQMNRQATLHNIQAICPSLAHILINCYQDPVAMHTSNGDIIWSKEGTTQGDPLSMAMYALGVTPLIKKLYQKCANTTQVWFADDSAAASSLTNLHEWLDSLIQLSLCFGYEVIVNKCWLVVKPHSAEQALHSSTIQAFRSQTKVALILGWP